MGRNGLMFFYDCSLVKLIRNIDIGITEICNYFKNKTIYGFENERSFLLSLLLSVYITVYFGYLLNAKIYIEPKRVYLFMRYCYSNFLNFKYFCWTLCIYSCIISHFYSIVCFHFSCLSVWTFFSSNRIFVYTQ